MLKKIDTIQREEKYYTFIYTIYNNTVVELGYFDGTSQIHNNLVLSNGKYAMVVYEIGTDSADKIFYAEYNREHDVYDYEGNTLSYQECLDEAEIVLGADIDSLSKVKLDYDLNSIRTAIVEYDSAEEASGSSATRAAEIDTTAKYYDSMYRFKTFSLENQRLKAETCDGEIVLDLEVSDDCLWQSRYIMVLCMKVHMMSCTAFGKICHTGKVLK